MVFITGNTRMLDTLHTMNVLTMNVLVFSGTSCEVSLGLGVALMATSGLLVTALDPI
jgi:hypothetical protein